MADKIKLTIRTVELVKPSIKDVIVRDAELTNFRLKVTPKGKRTFFIYYRAADRTQRKPTIGDYPAIKPNEARDIARDWLMEVRKGGDPSLMRQRKRASYGEGTIENLFEAYLAHKKKQGRRSVRQIEQNFRHDILPVLGKRRAEDVTRRDVTSLLGSIEKRSVSVAGATRRQLSAFYTWAIPHLPDAATNPVTSASRPPAIKTRDRVLSHEELRALWIALEEESDVWRTALRLLILTGQRVQEVLGADWSEIDLAAKIWTIPAARAKNGHAHIVPLSLPVLQLIKARPDRSGPLFPVGTGPVSRAAKRIREAMGDVPAWRWHDIRRTTSTNLQRLGIRWEVTEAVQNHMSGSRAGIAGIYQRHDWAEEKRHALNQWAKEVARLVKAKAVKKSAAARRSDLSLCKKN